MTLDQSLGNILLIMADNECCYISEIALIWKVSRLEF